MLGNIFSNCCVFRLPTLFFIKDGSLQYKMEGALTADELAKLVDYVLFDGPRPNEIDGVPRAE